MNAGSWIWTNKEWLFDGFGAAVIIALGGLILRWLRRKRVDSVTEPFDLEMFVIPATAKRPSPFWLAAEKLPGFRRIARNRIYTEEEITRRIRVTIRSDGDGISFWKTNPHAGTANVYLDIVNVNPFPLKVDCITGHATVAGAHVGEIKIVDKHLIPAVGWKDVYFEFKLTSADVEQIEFQMQQRADAPAGVMVRIYLKTEVRELTLSANPATGNRRFLNFVMQKPMVGAGGGAKPALASAT